MSPTSKTDQQIHEEFMAGPPDAPMPMPETPILLPRVKWWQLRLFACGDCHNGHWHSAKCKYSAEFRRLWKERYPNSDE